MFQVMILQKGVLAITVYTHFPVLIIFLIAESVCIYISSTHMSTLSIFCFRRCLRDSISCTRLATLFLWHRCWWPSPSSAISSKKQKTRNSKYTFMSRIETWANQFFSPLFDTHTFQASPLHTQLHPYSPLHLLHLSGSKHFCEGRRTLLHFWWK